MPFSIIKEGHHFKVINKITGKIHAYHTTLPKAMSQIRIMEKMEHLKKG
jgi:hypothetical protein